MKGSLFEPAVAVEKLGANFNAVRLSPGHAAARQMMDSAFEAFDDADGNFLQQFQTSGFDARLFELYLFAYFSRSGFLVDRAQGRPDFVVSRNGAKVAVEATTVNPSTSGALSRFGRAVSALSEDEMREYRRHELPIRFGGPLSSKLSKRYWTLEHCRDLPFVIAIEAFHDKDSLALSDSALAAFLYGVEQTGGFLSTGQLSLGTTTIDDHRIPTKTIASSFFQQADAEHLSAVVFTNAGTTGKFSRMAWLHGLGDHNCALIRRGYCFDPHPEALDPAYFEYSVSNPPHVETWGEGLVVLHNPGALHPLPRAFFPGAVETRFVDGTMPTEYTGWHPISSTTNTLVFESPDEIEKKSFLAGMPLCIGALSRRAFEEIVGFTTGPQNPLGDEQGWYADDTHAFLGTVIHDKIDGDWAWVILARDEFFRFRAIAAESSLPTRLVARVELQHRMADLVRKQQRIFPGGVAIT